MSNDLQCAGSVNDSTSGVQLERSGSNPTPALQFFVEKITKAQAAPFILEIHYAKRFPPYSHLFGLIEDGKLVGVVSYGPPASPQVARSIGIYPVLELNRLVITTQTKNAASFLVGRSLRFLPSPIAVVSYADGMQGHIGYIYQATNFLYTGSPTAHDNYYLVGNKLTHPRSLAARGITAPVQWAKENRIEIVKSKPKHRYVFLRGGKSELKKFRGALKWPIFPYPKGESRRYNAPNQKV
jgi:hypothetical protein